MTSLLTEKEENHTRLDLLIQAAECLLESEAQYTTTVTGEVLKKLITEFLKARLLGDVNLDGRVELFIQLQSDAGTMGKGDNANPDCL